MSGAVRFSSWSCPLPLRDYPSIVMGHGGGGKLSAELVENLFVPAFGNQTLARLGDSAVLDVPAGRLAFSTDSFVVRPLFFPGGSIGDLAVNGTVNDLSMSGARPLCLSVGFIIEEGLPMERLGRIVEQMAEAARRATVTIVTGDTKVVERGRGDGCYINTAGIGVVADDVNIGPSRARLGDVVLLSGTIGDHGMAVMSVREALEFESVIESDSAPLTTLVTEMIRVGGDGIHVLRDPTRGGVASSLNEIASAANVGIVLEEDTIPVQNEVRSACELLGMDPIYVANEGKLLAIVAPERAPAVMQAMQSHPLGKKAAAVGTVTEKHRKLLVMRTGIGGMRVIPMQIGEQLPRIC